MKLLIPVLFLFTACATKQSKEQFLSSLDNYNKQNLMFSKKLLVSERGLKEFTERCLYQSTQPYVIIHEPSIEKSNGKTSLYVKQTVHSSFNISHEHYVYLATIWEGPKGSTVGEAYYTKSMINPDTSDISNRLMDWINKERKLCPSLN